MVKFSRELEAQLIPEWKDKFVNYRQLKKHVKKIKLAHLRSSVPSSSDDHQHNAASTAGGGCSPAGYGISLFDPIRSLFRIHGRRLDDPIPVNIW